VNRLHRHCRIGRVTKKVVIYGGERLVPHPRHWWAPDPTRPAPSPYFSGGYVHTVKAGDVPIVPAHGCIL
jgi:hypothetical protein